MGIQTIVSAANICGYIVERSPLKFEIPSISVFSLSDVIKTSANGYSFQTHRQLRMVSVAIIGAHIGSTT